MFWLNYFILINVKLKKKFKQHVIYYYLLFYSFGLLKADLETPFE